MADEVNIAEVANEIKNKSDEELKKTIKQLTSNIIYYIMLLL